MDVTPELLLRFPKLQIDLVNSGKRKLFFDGLSPELAEALIERGYEPVAVTTMPVLTSDDRRVQLRGISQGIADGTIEATTARLKGIELGMRSLGMLTDKNRAEKVEAREPENTAELIAALKGDQGSTLRETGSVDRKAILEEYGNSDTIRKADGKIRAAKKIKREKT